MRISFRNTTALVAAISIAAPGAGVSQTMLEACGPEQRPVTKQDLEAGGIEIPKDYVKAFEGKEVSPDIGIVEVDGAPGLCLTVGDMKDLGMTGPAIAAILKGEPAPSAADTASGAMAATADETPQPGKKEKKEKKAAKAEAETQAEAETEAEAEAETEAEAGAEQDARETEPVKPAGEAPEAANAGTEAQAGAGAGEEAQPQGADAEAQAEPGEAPAAGSMAENAAPEITDQKLRQQMKAIEESATEAADPETEARAAEAEAPESAVAAAEAEPDDADVVVEEKQVTEENSRSSGEAFDSAVNESAGGSGETTAAQTGQARSRDGLSDLEKALLVGLGAVVVGQALGKSPDTQVVQKSDDRVVVLEDGRYRVIRDDNELVERPGSTVRRETFADGSSRTVVTREDGVSILTIRDPELRVLRRVRIGPDGTRTVLIDDTQRVAAVDVTELPRPARDLEGEDALRAALEAQADAGRTFALYQVRNISQVRKLVPAIPLEAINFRTGSAVIDPQEAQELSALGNMIAEAVRHNPGEIFLIEGHTDAVGGAAYNLALSDRRAESVALALTEYFDVPPENLVVQGYGESDLKVRTLEAERANRRAAVRRITPLLRIQG